MGVRVDRARYDILAARLDHLLGLDVERLPDEGDPLILDEHVPDVVVGGGDDAAAFDQYGHLFTLLSTEKNPTTTSSSLIGNERPYGVEHDLCPEGSVRRVRILLRGVAYAAFARDEDHRARHSVGDAHRVVGRARVHSHVRLATLLRRFLQRRYHTPVQRRRREGLALGVLR